MMDQSSGSTLKDNRSNRNSTEHKQVNKSMTRTTYNSIDGNEFELRKIENRLKNNLEKCKMKDLTQLDERMKRTEERIQQYKDEDRNDEAEKERKYLNELKELKRLNEEIDLKTIELFSQTIDKLDLIELENQLKYGLEKYKIKDLTQLTERIKQAEKRIEQYEDEERTDAVEQEMKYVRDLKQLQKITEEIFFQKSTENNEENVENRRTSYEEENKRADLNNLLDDLTHIPYCAEKTIMELLSDLQQRLLEDSMIRKTFDSIVQKFEILKDQIENEELFSEQIRNYLQDLNRTIFNEDCLSTIELLKKILKKIRPLGLQEIQRLIEKTRKTATLINNKDIILLVGITGCGKSTTIQFLSGAKMKETLVEIAPGKFLEHITIDGPIRNPGLINVTTSPLSKSETRYIVAVTVQLKDIFDHYQTGEIILCDAPGFDDTHGPEIDIANSVGVIETLKNCRSVKILALSSYRSLGDRGQGIQKLAYILTNMIHGIHDKLYGIFYAFTKYPSTTDIHALLIDIKKSKVDQDPILRSDSNFVAVLTDMIDKTKPGAEMIDPIHCNPKSLIKKLLNLKGILYPREVFRSSMSDDTQNTILNQVQKYKLNIICAIKRKDTDLIMYYLNNFKILNDWINQSFVRDLYEDSIRLLSENIEQYCTNMMGKFNRILASQDGLNDEDIREYKIAHDYIQQIHNLREHLGSKLVSADILIENIISELEKISFTLKEQDLYSSSIGIYLNNISLLKNSFKQLESYYINICKEFFDRFEITLIKPVAELISTNEFKQVTEIIFIIWKCLPILNHHLNGKIEENYCEIFKLIFKHLNSFSDKANSILIKITLDNKDIEILENYMILLRIAKETFLLQDQICKYIEIMKIKNKISFETIKDLNQIYEEFIDKIKKYLNEIDLRIEKLLGKNGTYILEDIEQLVIQMEMIRTLPDIESKTARIFYHSIENIRGYMQQLQRDAEELFHNLDHQSEIINFRPLSRLLLRLKTTEWIDRICPGNSNSLMRHIREELEERANQLEHRFIKLDFSLKSPQNILLAKEIIENIESMKILEQTIPKLKIYRLRIDQYFLKVTNEVFDHIKKVFNLSEKSVDYLTQELIKLEQIKNEYDQLYPARIYLKEAGYSDINILNQDIENLKIRKKTELEHVKYEKHQIENQLDDLNRIIQRYTHLTSSKRNLGNVNRLSNKLDQSEIEQSNEYLKENGYENIEILNNTKKKIQDDHDKLVRFINQKRIEFNNRLICLESINEDYLALLASSNWIDPKEIDFLKEKGQQNYEILEKTIQEKKNILNEYEKHQQTYNFTNKLDILELNNALIYLSNCEKVRHHCVKEIAVDINQFLRKYIEEYGDFLQKEIERNFNNIININKDDLNQYSENLEKSFQELSSLEKYSLVFEILRGVNKIEYWHRQFFDYYLFLENKIEVCKMSGRNQELKNILIIVQALRCLDRFSTVTQVHYRFQNLYTHYQIHIIKVSREAYKIAKDFILKEDYSNADLSLSDIVENSLDSKFLNEIKHDLQTSLNKIIKNTKTSAYWLEGKFQQKEDIRDRIKEINENIDKIRLVLYRHRFIELIDEQTKILLENFENDINEILSQVILNRINNIELFLNNNSFLEAEQSMENLIPLQYELNNHYKSKLVDKKIEELKTRFLILDNQILQYYDFEDIYNYSNNSPKDLLRQLNKASSAGYAKYTQVYNYFMELIRINFSLAIEKIRKINSFNDRSNKIHAIKHAFLFLPEELKSIFQLKIDELEQIEEKQ